MLATARFSFCRDKHFGYHFKIYKRVTCRWKGSSDVADLAFAVFLVIRKVNTIYLEHIAQNTQPAGALLKNTAAETQARSPRTLAFVDDTSIDA